LGDAPRKESYTEAEATNKPSPPRTWGSAATGSRITSPRLHLSSEVLTAALLVAGFSLAILLRLFLVSTGDGFPLNDGGMFYAMVEDLKANAYHLPEYTSYNGGAIPFAYPPAAFYLAALISGVAGVSTIDLLVYLPLVFSAATILAFYLLASSMLPSQRMAVVAALVFAFVPRSFNWEIVGGGLTRSPGFFFAVLAIWQGYLLYTQKQKRHLIWAALLSALAILFHPEMGMFVVMSLGVFFLALDRSRQGFLRSALLGLAVLALSSPWWLEVLLRVGPEPLLAAMQTGGHSPFEAFRLALFRFTDESLFPIAAALGLLGILASYRDRQFLLPMWLLVIFLLDPRKAPTMGELPLALLASVGLFEVVMPLLSRRSSSANLAAETTPWWAYAGLGLIFFVYAPLSALLSTQQDTSPLKSLSQENRSTMAWIKENAPPTSTFLVMPSSERAESDPILEWFPALTERRSVGTMQGTEWLEGAELNRLVVAYDDLHDCAYSNEACVEAWAAEYHLSFTHLYLPSVRSERAGESIQTTCCPELQKALTNSNNYQTVFDGPGGLVLVRSDALAQ
jgi:hypothetical protein